MFALTISHVFFEWLPTYDITVGKSVIQLQNLAAVLRHIMCYNNSTKDDLKEEMKTLEIYSAFLRIPYIFFLVSLSFKIRIKKNKFIGNHEQNKFVGES